MHLITDEVDGRHYVDQRTAAAALYGGGQPMRPPVTATTSDGERYWLETQAESRSCASKKQNADHKIGVAEHR